MTYTQIVEIATRRGTLKWIESGIIEHIRLAPRPDTRTKLPLVIARKKGQSQYHCIRGYGIPVEPNTQFECIEVDPITKEPV